MLSKLIQIAGMIALATLLGAGGFGGYLYATGQLDADRIETLAKVLRGELDGLAEGGDGDSDRVEGGDAESQGEPTRRSAEEADARRRRENLESLRTERAHADVKARLDLLDQAMLAVAKEHERLTEREEDFAKQREKHDETVFDAGFHQELELVSKMKAETAKDHIVSVWQRSPDIAVRLISELSLRKKAEIIERFRTPEEAQIRTELLEQVRIQGTTKEAAPSGMTGSDRQP
jgi:flagellar motility protein MotE (MotC chaperone)